MKAIDLFAGGGGADAAIRDFQHEVPGMGMEYGRLRVAVKRAQSYREAQTQERQV